MSVIAVKSRHVSPSDDRRSCVRFPEGSLVEVRTDEEGLANVYFTGTVVPPPAPSPPDMLYVEFHDLVVRERCCKKLREFINVSFVRPTPPALQEEEEAARFFQRDDVVDAFFNDGWWIGVVSRVMGSDRDRVVVKFENPPDKREFGISDLRAHWDWENGVWVKKQSKTFTKSMFGVGKTVEISFDDDEDAWIPGIVLQCLKNGFLSVEFDMGEDVIAEVDSRHVRPCPLVLVNNTPKFVRLENVDAYLDHVWMSGVITKDLENGRYVVFLNQTKQDEEFSGWDLRPHMDWKDGKWLLSSFSDDEVGDRSSSTCFVDGKALSSLAPNQKKASLRKRSSVSKTVLKRGKKGDRVLRKKIRGVDEKQNVVDCALLDDEVNEQEAASSNEPIITNLELLAKDKEKLLQLSIITQDSLAVVDESSMLPGDQLLSLPYITDANSSSVWKTVESLQVFQRFPQKPHFKPLEHLSESVREGHVLGCMVAFARALERACSLQVNDPKSTLDEIMKTLTDMEEYGFDTSFVQLRLTKLLDLKVKLGKLEDEVNKFHNHISDHNQEKTRIEQEMRELQEKLAVAEFAKEKEDCEIALLQAQLEETKESIRIIDRDFEGVVSSIL